MASPHEHGQVHQFSIQYIPTCRSAAASDRRTESDGDTGSIEPAKDHLSVLSARSEWADPLLGLIFGTGEERQQILEVVPRNSAKG